MKSPLNYIREGERVTLINAFTWLILIKSNHNLLILEYSATSLGFETSPIKTLPKISKPPFFIYFEI